MPERPFWNPYVAGVVLGLVLLWRGFGGDRAATLVGGAVLGTIIGQVRGILNGFDLRLAAQAGPAVRLVVPRRLVAFAPSSWLASDSDDSDPAPQCVPPQP